VRSFEAMLLAFLCFQRSHVFSHVSSSSLNFLHLYSAEFLRGSEETWGAIKRGNYASVTCEACQADLCCIADADMVVCPDCRCVSPLDGRMMPTAAGGFSEGGVGLGVLVKDLAPAVQQRLGL